MKNLDDFRSKYDSKTIEEVLDSLRIKNYVFGGIAHPNDPDPQAKGNVAYFASEVGTYTNYGGVEMKEEGLAVITYNGNLWNIKQVLYYSPSLLYNRNRYFFKLDDENLIASIIKNDTGSVTVNFRKAGENFLGVGSNSSKSSFKWCNLSDNLKSVTLENSYGLLANLETGEIEKSSTSLINDGGSVLAEDKYVLLLINLYGNVTSPYAVIQSSIDKIYVEKIDRRTKNIPFDRNLYTFTVNGDNIIDSIVSSKTDATITFNKTGENVIGVGSYDNSIPFTLCRLAPSLKSIKLSNGYGILANLKEGELEVSKSLISGDGLQQLGNNDFVLLFINLYGNILSPSAFVQSLIDRQTQTKINDCFRTELLKHEEEKKGINLGYTLLGENVNIVSDILGSSPQFIENAITKESSFRFAHSNGYIEKIVKPEESGYWYWIKLPKCQEIEFIFSYRSNAEFSCGIYERDSASDWLNNGGAVIKEMPIVTKEMDVNSYFSISRKKEDTAVEAVLVIGRKGNPLDPIGKGNVLEIGFLQALSYGEINSKDDFRFTNIVVAKDGSGDFTSIRNAMASIKDSSETNRYKIFIKNGEYNEIDIHSKEYVDIEGESRDGVIIYTDGLSSELSPSDYSWKPEYRGVPINTIPKAWKHQWILMNNCILSNMTMKIKQVKYAIHQDNEGQAYTSYVKNCVFIREEDANESAGRYDKGLTNLIGIGASANQHQIYEDCILISRVRNMTPEYSNNTGLIWHNWRKQTAPASLTIKRCKWIGCNFMDIRELGSTQEDWINIVDCSTDGKYNGIIYTATPESSGGDVSAVPYNIHINASGTKLGALIIGEGREKVAKMILGVDILSSTFVDSCEYGMAIAKPIVGYGKATIATKPPFGVAMENVSNGFVFLNQADSFMGLAEAGEYSYGDKAYLSDGIFTKKANGDQVGVFSDTAILTKKGLLKINKI